MRSIVPGPQINLTASVRSPRVELRRMADGDR